MHKKVNIIIYSIIVILLIYLVIMHVIDYFKIKEFNHFMHYLGTDININIYDNKIDNQLFEEIENIYEEYDLLTSNKESERHNLYYINNSDEELIDVDPKLYEILKIGLDYYNKSNGLININMGCIYDMVYTYGEDNKCNININQIELLENYKIKNNDFNINLDNIRVSYVNSIVSNYLKEKGYKNFIINTLGNVVVGEKDFDSKPFSVGVQYDVDGIIGVVNLSNKSMVSKGIFSGYKNLISPKTLLLNDNYLNVSVISNDNMLSNYLVNILYYNSIEEGEKIIKQYDAEAIWVLKDKTVKYTNSLDYKKI